MAKDYYDTLDVDKNSSKEEIKKAYRKLAMKYHPDVSKDNNSEKKFKEINEAASVLLDDTKKQQYDTYGSTDGPQGSRGFSSSQGFNPQDFGINLDDIFEQFGFGGGFSRQSRRSSGEPTIQKEVDLTLDEVYFGVKKNIKILKKEKCKSCKGLGGKNPHDVETCSTCNGQGVVIEVQRSFLGSIKTQKICNSCRGSGKKIKNKCPTCSGGGVEKKEELVEIQIPKGVERGVTLRVSQKGSYDFETGSYGDLHIRVNIKKHTHFEVEGSDLYMKQKINFIQAILGDDCEFEHFSKDLSLKIPQGTQSGTILRLKGKGLPEFDSDDYGNLYVKINVDLPKKTTEKQRELLLSYAKTMKNDNFFGKMKNLFS